VDVELPAEGHQQRGENGEQEALHAQPDLEREPDALGHLVGEGHQGQRVEVHVVAQLLGHAVVLVVLDAPPGAAHAAAQAVEGDLQRPVHEDVARQRVVPALMHEPAAAPLSDPVDQDPRDGGKKTLPGQEPEGHGEQHEELCET